MLIELDMLDEATQVLEGMLEEDDQVVDTWYLLGWINRLRATAEDGGDEGYNGNVRFYLGKAKAVHKANPTDDSDMVKHIDEILAEVGPGAQEEEEEEEKNGDHNGDEWEDLDSSDGGEDNVEMEEY